MKTKSLKSTWRLVAWCLGVSLSHSFIPVVAQDNGPVFWTQGGQWGAWSTFSIYPGVAVRVACGDNTTLNNYPVSSEDWQIRNGYTKPVAIVWRVQFFDKTTGKNAMAGWMLEHLQPGEISDGWTVVSGHCQARNALFVQLKCMAPEGEEGKQCFKDSNGNPYPLRAAGAFRGDHKPTDAQTSESPAPAPTAQPPLPEIKLYTWCYGFYHTAPYEPAYVSTEVILTPLSGWTGGDSTR